MTDASAAPMVIVVDDDPSIRKSLGRLFRSTGFEVETFSTAEEFLGSDSASAGGCAIVDVHLGRLSGLELRAALGARADRMQFIFITGVDNADTEAASRAQGAAFFHKPFDAGALVECVRQCLDATRRRASSDEVPRRAPSAPPGAAEDGRRIIRDDAPHAGASQASRL